MSRRVQAGSKLAETLSAGRLAILAECLPPRRADRQALKTAAAVLPQSLDAVVVPDGGCEVRACALAGALLVAQQGHEPVLSLATRDRNRIALRSDILGAAALGIVNLLCRSGEHQTRGECPQAAGVFDVDTVQLLLQVRQLEDEAASADEMPEARETVFPGALAHPGLTPRTLSIMDVRKKVEAGARFLLTDPIFDVDGFRDWAQTVRDHGIHERCHIIASVKPLESAAQAEDMRERQRGIAIPDEVIARLNAAGDPRREGLAICAEIAGQLRRIEGVRGIEIACGGGEEVVAEIIEQASLRGK